MLILNALQNRYIIEIQTHKVVTQLNINNTHLVDFVYISKL